MRDAIERIRLERKLAFVLFVVLALLAVAGHACRARHAPEPVAEPAGVFQEAGE